MVTPLVYLIGGALSLVSGLAWAKAPDPHFPEPAALRAQVDFWERVYVEISTDAGFVHDNQFMGVVYDTVRFTRGSSSAAQARAVRASKAHWREVLRALGRGVPGPAGSQADARSAARLWRAALGHAATRGEYLAAADRLRFQRGQRDKFERGLVRAGAFEARIRRILAEHDLPADLAYLPHVESSFNALAYSKHGAAGMWQFMPATARRYLRVDWVVDERLDPERATRAAAKLLRRNYLLLGTWPLAITAYNHGAEGVRRARARVGSADIADIVTRYRGPRFGFASRNFYGQFLAARRVVRAERRHFGRLIKARPQAVGRVELPFYLDFAVAARALGVKPAQLRGLNPSLRPAVLRSEKHIPKGFGLRIPRGPRGAAGSREGAWMTRVALADRHGAQRPTRTHTVRRGETLGHIARRYGTTVARLSASNRLNDRHRIFPGQRLELAAAPPRSDRSKRGSSPVRTKSSRVDSARPDPKPAPARAALVPTEALPLPPARRALHGRWAFVAHRETLGHFADWLDLPSGSLRRLNELSSRHRLRVGQRLRLDFSKVPREQFSARRSAYHRAIEQRYLARYRVTGTKNHTLQSGENLWFLSRKLYRVPSWLLHRYNPHAGGKQLLPGTRIRVPIVTLVNAASADRST